MKIEFYTKNNKLYRKNSTEIIHLSQNNIELQFNIDEPQVTEETYVLIESPQYTYRIQLEKKDGLWICDFPHRVSESKFFKVSLYSILEDEDRWTTNIIIVPLDRSGYMEYKPQNKHTNAYVYCDGEEKQYFPDVFKYLIDVLKTSINYLEFKERKAYGYHEENGEKDLIQVIPLPNWVTAEELNNFMGDIITDIELDETDGELYKVQGTISFPKRRN